MEPRIITIISTVTQKKSTITSSATTLGELKEDLTKAGIDYTGLSFYEGVSKTELKMDDSLLPKDLEYKGTITNNLVFMLTKPQNKIKSGLDRKAMYSYIKDNNLQADFKNKYNKNYTNATNIELEDFYKCYSTSTSQEANQVEVVTKEQKESTNNQDLVKLQEAFNYLVECVYNEDGITFSQYTHIKAILNGNVQPKEDASVYSQNEIDEMFKGMI